MTRETETRHSANEVRETVESSTTQWEDPKRTERHGDQGPRAVPESFLEVSRPSGGKLPHWHRSSDYAVAEYYTAVLE